MDKEQETLHKNNISEETEMKNIDDSQDDSNQTSGKDQNDTKQTSSKDKEITPVEKIKELEEKLTRTFAEMENQRRRFEKEKEDAFEYGGFLFAKEALNLIDNLERSKEVLKSDDKLMNTDALNKTLEHLDILYKDLISIFNKNNIKIIDCLNKKLDPNFHQAMMEIEDNQKEPGTIIQEIQKGFIIKDRLLRPSLVAVSKNTENKNQEFTENQENKENN